MDESLSSSLSVLSAAAGCLFEMILAATVLLCLKKNHYKVMYVQTIIVITKIFILRTYILTYLIRRLVMKLMLPINTPTITTTITTMTHIVSVFLLLFRLAAVQINNSDFILHTLKSTSYIPSYVQDFSQHSNCY